MEIQPHYLHYPRLVHNDYFWDPKQMELIKVTMEQVVQSVNNLNNRPRKCLNFKTPYEVFNKLTGIDVRKIMGYALIT